MARFLPQDRYRMPEADLLKPPLRNQFPSKIISSPRDLIHLSKLESRKNIMKLLNWKCPLIIAAVLAATAMTASAATCSVPSAYPTIQAAVDDPTCTTINVAPGAYIENVSIPRSVTLNGAQAGQPVAGRTSGGPSESTVSGANPAGPSATFTIDAPTVTIDGFSIKNAPATGAATGVQIKTNGNDAVVLNNFIDGIASADAGSAGVFVQDGPDNVNLSSNSISNVTSTGSAKAILVDSATTDLTDILFIKDNTITGITSTNQGAYALQVGKLSVSSVSLQFLTNHLSNLAGAAWVHAVSLECDLQDPLIQNNDFTNLTSASGGVAAVWINNDPHADTTSVSGNNFNLTEADFGVKLPDNTTFPSLLGAGCNWWGSADGPGPVGPGHGAQVSPGVLYAPWRIAPTPDSCIGNNVPTTEAQCKNGGWTTAVHPDGTVFKSQGDCVQFVNNGK
jgi:hypothetical protein